MTARTDPQDYYDRDLRELHRWEQAMSNASDSTPKAQPLTGAEAQVNWDLLRRSVERDLASARAASKRTGDFFDHRAYAYQLVLDSMDVFEFGLAYWQAKTQAERDAQAAPGTEFRDCSCGQRVYLAQRGWYHWIDGSPVSACAPGLAEHTQAAPDEVEPACPDCGCGPMPGMDPRFSHERHCPRGPRAMGLHDKEGYVPGLAEHTQAAQPAKCACRHAKHPDMDCTLCGCKNRSGSANPFDDPAHPFFGATDLVGALASHTQAACDTITKADQPEYCDRSWHDGDCCEGSRRDYAAKPGTITKASQ